MNKNFEAKIYWLSEMQGGRKTIPFSNTYAPIIKIDGDQFKTNDFWSVFIVNQKILSKYETLSHLKYLSDVAPNNLVKGVKFTLYEGNRVVANGVVLREIASDDI